MTTALNTPYDPWSRTVLALAGRTGVGLYKCGPGVQSKREAAGLVFEGREYKTAMLIPAGIGADAMVLPSALNLVNGLDPDWSGIALNADCFTPQSGLSDDQLRQALPKVKAISIFDVAPDGAPQPLGKGSVEFDRLFETLAQVRFAGPLTVYRKYRTSDEPGALSRDAEFVRKHTEAAYGRLKS